MKRQLLALIAGKQATSKVVGHVDEIQNGVLYGWAWYPAKPELRPLIDVYIDGRFEGQTCACLRRDDLAANHIGDGCYGFELCLRPGTKEQGVRALVVGANRPELISFRPGTVIEFQRVRSPETYLRATFSAALLDAAPKNRSTASKVSTEAGAGRVFDKLFDQSPVPSPPPIAGRPLCAYLDYQRHRWELQNKFAVGEAVEEYERFLQHYIGSYGRSARPQRVPLSADDIAYLNKGPTHESPFGPSKLQSLCAPARDSENDEAANSYRWAVYHSRALNIDDCLLAPALRDALSACENDGAPYPLSRFMKRFLAENTFLADIDIGTEDGRMLAYFAVLLFAITAPHLCNYVPSGWLDAFLDDGKAGCAPFDLVAAHVLPGVDLDAHRWRALLDAAGFDIRQKKFRSVTPRGDRLEAASLRSTGERLVDVQIIAPFSRQLGISQSALTLADAIESLGYSLRLCDFTREHPNAPRDSKRDLREPGPTRVNIVHLNLEDLPDAVAYFPDVFTGAPLVAFPYLELPTLSAAQRLGVSLVDEIWSASEFTTRTLSAHKQTFTVGTALRPIRSVGKANARRIAYRTLVEAEDFVFLTTGDALSGARRKNPLGAIRAFVHAFPNDRHVKLVVKVHSLERVAPGSEIHIWQIIQAIAAQDSRIILLDKVFDDDEQLALIEGADCLVSLHRAEGFGYHMLEAMALDTPVIATAYSGNMDFCNELTSVLIPAEIVHLEHGDYPRASAAQTWAEPDFEASVAAMRTIYANPRFREGLAENAREFAQRHFSLGAFAARVDARLRAVGGFQK
ncbi:glycosyltransferase family 4 protein [Methylocystis sp. JR02]|uniref:glycosyltransferase family 4 protein n=1 Tax=Methylocystis sp. JR02 TaxID=3046284 RepID=UPI0024B8E1AE|nr:glycosyltransferase family 4 protein [Methylocystis sp. JR02]MDJ0448757.1 glycosyltransferase family 4 protein [Methylocystis sp. JR02]